MPTHDIIDNRTEKLVDHIRTMLASSESAKFAVGYFFVSGLESVADQIAALKELRLLIGNTSNQETLEQIAEGYQRLERVAEAIEGQTYRKQTDARRMAGETADHLRTSMAVMDQTDAGEHLIKLLVRLIEEQRLKVRIYTKGRLHAKAYIFNYAPLPDMFGQPTMPRYENGIAIVGSSNFTLSGVTHNTELNVVVAGNDNHAALTRWFDDLWNEAEDFDLALMQAIKRSWAVAEVTPYDIYLKTLYTLVKDRLDGTAEPLWDDEIIARLADFQKVAVKHAVQIIRDYGGAFVADVVGLGKSYIGAAIVKHFERVERARPLIICPKSLEKMWERYNEIYHLNARVLPMSLLKEDDAGQIDFLLREVKYRDRDFVLIDESHNFRNPDSQRFKVLQAFLATGRKCCLLTATPRNNSAWDVYYQIKLFHQDDVTTLPIDPPDLNAYFKLIEAQERTLPALLVNLLIRRTRNHIVRWYGFDAETHQPIDPARFQEYLDGTRRAYVMVAGKEQYFPRRELHTIEYSIEATYQGLYQQLRRYFGVYHRHQPERPEPDELTYARYGLWHYVKPEKQNQRPYNELQRAGINLRGLIRVMLFKRFESSVYAFRATITRMIVVHQRFLDALAAGIVPAGEDAQSILYEPNQAEEADLMDALSRLASRYKAEDFDVPRLRVHVEHDIKLLKKILDAVEPITPDQDAKLQELLRHLKREPLNTGKRLIFTQYADTARYLYENLNPLNARADIDVIFSGDKSKDRVVGRFAPKANPEYRFAAGEVELNTVIATDVLSEGLNMQDCDKVVNYDLHWNPVRLIQRFGRIDRIGAEHDVVHGFNFLPETELDRNLGLRETLRRRVQEIQDTIGEDSQILDPTERLNPEAMYAIYEKDGQKLSQFEDEEDFLDLNEAEEMMRQLRAERPAEFERIATLSDGLRTGKTAKQPGLYVFCQAGGYQRLYLLDEQGEVISRDIPRVLGAIKCAPDTPAQPLPPDYNAAVMKVKRQFAEEARTRQTEMKHTLALRQGQRYVLRELRVFFGATEDEDVKAQINILEKAFRVSPTEAVNRELNRLRREAVTGAALLKRLIDIYYQHNMKDWLERKSLQLQEDPIPIIVCSEKLG